MMPQPADRRELRIDISHVDIWHIALAQPSAVLAQLHPLLSPAEQARAARFVYPQHRERFVIAHAALRLILASYTAAPLTLLEGPNGKPYLAGHPIHFNLTHAGDLALLAVSPTQRLGIDLEPIRPMPDALSLAREFHPNEQARINATHPDPQTFFTLWTRKEAYVKATGEGLSRPLASFDTTAPIPNWHLVDLPIPNHAATLALEATTPAPPPIDHQTWHPPKL